MVRQPERYIVTFPNAFRIPACERGLEAVSTTRTVRMTSTGLAVDERVHDWSSHAASALKVIAEAEAAGMLHSVGSTANVERMPQVTVLTGFRRGARDNPPDSGQTYKPRRD